MALDFYYPNDIQRILLALASAGSGNGPEYHKALYDVALAFGLSSQPSSQEAPNYRREVHYGVLPPHNEF